MYENGRGLEQNHPLAVEWYCKAAEQGHSKAQYLLGRMYENGTGVKKNDGLAMEWFHKEANQGLAEAKAKLRA